MAVPRCPVCSRPRLLDNFAGEGGAGAGYMRAGFCVDAVDTSSARLSHYPRDCPAQQRIVADAIVYTLDHGHEYAATHNSPTCTGYSAGTRAIPDRVARYDRLIGAIREAAQATGRPYLIENVAGARAELRDPVMLCGRMFRLTATDVDGTPLTLDRHRLFEISGFPVLVPEHVPHGWVSNRREGVQVAGAYGAAQRTIAGAKARKGGYVPSIQVQRELLGTPWMTGEGCKLSIPPVYTEHLGRQLLAHLTS